VKLSVNKRQVVIAGGVAAVVLVGLTMGRPDRDDRGGKLDAAATQACDDFAEGLPAARGKATRLALADKISTSVAGTDNDAVADRVSAVGRSANDGDTAWKAAATALTQACRDAGWS